MLTHIGYPNPKKCSKSQFLKNPTWRTAAILNNVKCNIPATVPPILMKFGMTMHLSPPHLMGKPKISKFQNRRWWMAASLKIEKS